MTPKIKVFLDLETRSSFDVSCGSRKQAECPEARVHCMAFGINKSDKINLWLPGAPPPAIFCPDHPRWNDIGFYAYSAEFELGWFEVYFHKRLGWPAIPDDKWYCIRIDSLACGLPKNLDGVAKALGTKWQKDTEAGKIVKMAGVSRPRTPTKDDLRRWFTPKDEPELFRKMYAYCKVDVGTQRDVYYALPRHITEDPVERSYFLDTIDVNRRGLPIDAQTAIHIHDRVEGHKQLLNKELQKITGGNLYSGGQAVAIREYLNVMYDSQLPNLKAEILRMYVDKCKDTIDPVEKRIIQIRQDVSNTSPAKYLRMVAAQCEDGTVKQNYVHHGAITGRHAAKGGFQSQNMARPSEQFGWQLKADGIDSLIDAIWYDDYDILNLFHDGCTQLAKDLIRSMILAPEGFKFLCADFKGVEMRGVMWQCLERKLLMAVAQGLDPYKLAASEMFGVPYDDVTSYQRGAGKIAVLACGYQGGYQALISMGIKYGIYFEEEEAEEIVTLFRTSRPRLKPTWKHFGKAAMMALKSPGRKVKIKNTKPVLFQQRGRWLFMQLPSGRELCYAYPEIRDWPMPWGEDAPAVTYMRMNPDTHNWERTAMSGGNLFQHCVQGACRDLLMYSEHRLDKRGYPTILSTHDELMAIVPDKPEYNLPYYLEEMSQKPTWAADFPLEANGWEGYRYRK